MEVTKWGPEIKKIRQEKGITQRRFALLAGVNRSMLRKIEAGDIPGDYELLEKCVAVLGYEFELMPVQVPPEALLVHPVLRKT